MAERVALGRMVKVGLREAWLSEAGDFTPWLAKEENLRLLGDTIGLELELEAQEKDVGPFRADILCKDTIDGHWVLIENQLERTDHTHLGQLITYAAGLKAVTIVWVAQRFTDEHRAALDWLNNMTAENINFFGLEIELWRIGDSPVAPKFNIVSNPNDWIKAGPGNRPESSGALTETRQLQLDFWTGLKQYILDRGSILKPQKPLAQGWASFAIGRSGFHLNSVMNTRDGIVRAELVLDPPDAKAHFHLLKQEQTAIEAEAGIEMEWTELPEKKASYVRTYLSDLDLEDRDTWPKIFEWLTDTLEKYHAVFSDRVRDLDAGDYEAEEPEAIL